MPLFATPFLPPLSQAGASSYSEAGRGPFGRRHGHPSGQPCNDHPIDGQLHATDRSRQATCVPFPLPPSFALPYLLTIQAGRVAGVVRSERTRTRTCIRRGIAPTARPPDRHMILHQSIDTKSSRFLIHFSFGRSLARSLAHSPPPSLRPTCSWQACARELTDGRIRILGRRRGGLRRQ